MARGDLLILGRQNEEWVPHRLSGVSGTTITKREWEKEVAPAPVACLPSRTNRQARLARA